MLDRIPEIKTDVSELTDDNILATIERRNKKMEEQITSLETKYKETRQTNSDLEDKLKHSDAEYAEKKKLKAENARGLLEDLRNELNREKSMKDDDDIHLRSDQLECKSLQEQIAKLEIKINKNKKYGENLETAKSEHTNLREKIKESNTEKTKLSSQFRKVDGVLKKWS